MRTKMKIFARLLPCLSRWALSALGAQRQNDPYEHRDALFARCTALLAHLGSDCALLVLVASTDVLIHKCPPIIIKMSLLLPKMGPSSVPTLKILEPYTPFLWHNYRRNTHTGLQRFSTHFRSKSDGFDTIKEQLLGFLHIPYLVSFCSRLGFYRIGKSLVR